MDTHVHVLLVTLERDVELILMSVLQPLVSMATALYVILNLLISDLLPLLHTGSYQWLPVLL